MLQWTVYFCPNQETESANQRLWKETAVITCPARTGKIAEISLGCSYTVSSCLISTPSWSSTHACSPFCMSISRRSSEGGDVRNLVIESQPETHHLFCLVCDFIDIRYSVWMKEVTREVTVGSLSPSQQLVVRCWRSHDDRNFIRSIQTSEQTSYQGEFETASSFGRRIRDRLW